MWAPVLLTAKFIRVSRATATGAPTSMVAVAGTVAEWYALVSPTKTWKPVPRLYLVPSRSQMTVMSRPWYLRLSKMK